MGSGPEGSPLGFDKLIDHKFFEEINFEELPNTEVPKNYKIIEKLYEENENSDDVDNFKSFDKKKFNTSKSSILCQASKTPKSKTSFKVIKEGFLKKKCGWVFYKKRKLILTALPKISYYEPDTNIHKGDIILTRMVKVQEISPTAFTITIPRRTYRFEGSNKDEIKDWVKSINDAIRIYYVDQK